MLESSLDGKSQQIITESENMYSDANFDKFESMIDDSKFSKNQNAPQFSKFSVKDPDNIRNRKIDLAKLKKEIYDTNSSYILDQNKEFSVKGGLITFGPKLNNDKNQNDFSYNHKPHQSCNIGQGIGSYEEESELNLRNK